MCVVIDLIDISSGSQPATATHTDLSDTADILSSYFVTDARIWEEVILGGNSSEAVTRSSNSSSSKPTASFTASGAVGYATVLRLLVGSSVDGGAAREFTNGSKAGVELEEAPCES
jgi:hypothetical protein